MYGQKAPTALQGFTTAPWLRARKVVDSRIKPPKQIDPEPAKPVCLQFDTPG
jgi:hypothetical protein